MAATTENSTGFGTFTATAAAMDLGVRVKIDSSGNVSAAGVTDHWIGVTTHTVAASGRATIKFRGAPGTLLFKTAGVVTVGNRLYAAANGTVDDAQTGSPTAGYIASSASGAAGDIIEAVPASDTSVVIPFSTGTIPMTSIANGDLLTNWAAPCAGTITQFDWVQVVPVTTAAKLATINLEIGTADLTGGTIALTSAACTPLGKVITSAAITGANTFATGDTISIEASSVTAFVEGSGYFVISYIRN